MIRFRKTACAPAALANVHKARLASAAPVTVCKNAPVVERLEAFVNAETPQLVRLLTRTWGDQQQAITYKELEAAIRAGELSMTVYEQWQQQYARLVTEELASTWERAIDGAYNWAKKAYGATATDEVLPFLDNYFQTRSAEFVTNVSGNQIKAMRAMIRRAGMTGDISNAELARMIRPTIGLTERDANAVANYYEQLRRNGYGPKAAKQRQDAYAAKLHRKRAQTIADYEVSRAHACAEDLWIGDCQRQGLLGRMNKRWITEGTERVCKVCSAMNDVVVAKESDFTIPSKHVFHCDFPPVHPHCHCAVLYEEVEEGTGEREQFDVALNPESSSNVGIATDDNLSFEQHNGYKPLTAYDFDDNVDVEVDPAVAQLVNATSERVCKDFPAFDRYLDFVGYGNSGDIENPATVDLAVTPDGRVGQVLSLNRNMWNDLEGLAKLVAQEAATGGHVMATTPDAILTHEYGHVAYNSTVLKRLGYAGGGMLSDGQRIAFSPMMEMLDSDIKKLASDSSLLSKRATNDLSEFVAEAFSDYYSGSRSKLSKAVVKFFKEELK